MTMTQIDYYDRQIPDYYKEMYLDGYTPEQIAYALRRKMIQDHEERQMVNEIKITSEVRLR
jgi:hypothetical protein